MNVVYLSPAFPPTARHFSKALKKRGIRVLAVSDEPTCDAVRDVTDAYYVAHACRRRERRYVITDTELVSALRSSLVGVESVPAAIADTMGDVAYLLRNSDLAELGRAISLVQTESTEVRAGTTSATILRE